MAEKVKNKAAGKPPQKQSEDDEKGARSASRAATPKTASKAAAKPAKSDGKKAKAAAAKKPNILQRFLAYLKNVRLEIKRTSWPGRAEVGRMSLIVIGALVFFGVTIFGIDTLMTWLVGQYSLAFSGYDSLLHNEIGEALAGVIQAVIALPGS